jgi:hypothetical protein
MGRGTRRAGATRRDPDPELEDRVKELLSDSVIDELLGGAQTEAGITDQGGLLSQLRIYSLAPGAKQWPQRRNFRRLPGNYGFDMRLLVSAPRMLRTLVAVTLIRSSLVQTRHCWLAGPSDCVPGARR